MRFIVTAALMLLAASCAAAPAFAAPLACSPRADVLAQLSRKFSEQPISIGLANNGSLLEVLSSRDGSTWTVIVTTPRGISCLVAAGEDWQALDVTVEPEGPGI